MGLTVILHHQHPYLLRLAAYLTTLNPHVRVLVHQLGHSNSYLIDRARLGLAIEVGPIAQGTLHAELFQQTEALVRAILDFVERCNQGATPEIPETFTLYNQVQIVDYPRDEQQRLWAMIHPQLQGRDYEWLHPGDPLFLSFAGETICYQGDSTMVPVFVNEAAYYEKNYALGLALPKQVTFHQPLNHQSLLLDARLSLEKSPELDETARDRSFCYRNTASKSWLEHSVND